MRKLPLPPAIQLAMLLCCGLPAAIHPDRASAQVYPAKPLRLVVPFPAGGASDILARTVADKLGDAFKQQVIVDNRAVTGKARLPELPAVPAAAETLPGFEASVWYGILAPAGIPKDIVIRLNTEVNRILGLSDVRERLVNAGFRTLAGTTEEFSAYMKSEGAKWAKVIRDSGTRVAD